MVILNKYGSENIYKRNNKYNWDYKNKALFHNFGINLILNEGDTPDELETQYIAQDVRANEKDFIKLLFFLIGNDATRLTPNLELFIEVVILVNDLEYVAKVLNKHICYDRYTYNNRHRDDFEDWFSTYLENHIDDEINFSDGLNKFILLLSCLCPNNFYFLPKYVESIIKAHTLDAFIDNLRYKELKTRLDKIRKDSYITHYNGYIEIKEFK